MLVYDGGCGGGHRIVGYGGYGLSGRGEACSQCASIVEIDLRLTFDESHTLTDSI